MFCAATLATWVALAGVPGTTKTVPQGVSCYNDKAACEAVATSANEISKKGADEPGRVVCKPHAAKKRWPKSSD
jgi:hypothetical protein